MPKVKLNFIECLKPEESEDNPWAPGDELRLDARIDREKYFTLAVWKGNEFVTGTRRYIGRAWDFREIMEFRLVELDGYTSDESLGSGVLEATAEPGEGTLHFTEMGADYTIGYVMTRRSRN